MPQKSVYTFADLQNWESVTSGLENPAKIAVFGDPVSHSLSPEMHNPGLKAAGIDAEYVRLHIKPEELGDAFQLLSPNQFIGVNVTVPHKAEALRFVDEITDVARRTGAVNTVLVDSESGKLTGHSTDGLGFLKAIRKEFSVDLRDLRILILGAGGGAGRAVAVQCAMERCERLVLANRTLEKADALKSELESFFHDASRLEGPSSRLSSVELVNEFSLEREMENIDLVVNATSIGMKTSDPQLISSEQLEPHQLVFDMIYSPRRTRLLAAAEANGARIANGLSMLLWQGAMSFEYWFNREAPVDCMRKGLLSALER